MLRPSVIFGAYAVNINMPKAKRYFEAGLHYHLTQRCHGRDFLLKFACDRNMYRRMLCKLSKAHHTPMLGYCFTSNHVHLLVTAPGKGGISKFMDALAGDFAQYYNLRKGRSGAFWGGRFHATAIEGGEHLWHCITYIDMNMVRAGVVNHPRDWKWCSYGELVGERKRYRLIDRDHFSLATGLHPDSGDFKSMYQSLIQYQLLADRCRRQPWWSESLAVGSEQYIKQVRGKVRSRMRLESDQLEGSYKSAWILREVPASYNA